MLKKQCQLVMPKSFLKWESLKHVSEIFGMQYTAMGRSWVAVEQTLKFLPLARVRNDIVYEPEASRQCHSLREQEEEISMSARLPPRNDIVSIYVKPPLNK